MAEAGHDDETEVPRIDKVAEDVAVEAQEKVEERLQDRKRKFDRMVIDTMVPMSTGAYKNVVRTLRRPTYLLGIGPVSGSFRWDNRAKLCYLLRKLMRQHNWAEASGVLSILLNASSKDTSLALNRLKFSASMELLKRVEGDRINLVKIRNIYEIWMSRIRSKKGRLEDRVAIHCEFILFYLMHGGLKEAHQATISLLKGGNLRSHPKSNMIMGFTFYQLWYSNLPEDVKLINSDKVYHCRQSDNSGARLSNQIEWSEENFAIINHDANNNLQHHSDTSVMNDRRIMEADTKQLQVVLAETHANLQNTNLAQEVQPQSVYLNSSENEEYSDDVNMLDPSIFSALEGLESWLLPLRLPHSSEDFVYLHGKLLNNNYKDALKFFQEALNSTPPVLAALLPLVQLLLIGGQVNKALKELKKFCNNSNSALPFRIRTSLFKCFYSNDAALYATVIEDSLKKDPTCYHELEKLVKLHQQGNYSLESLVEMIALHLDATYAKSSTWREFASCLLKLSQYDEDRMSACLNGNQEEQKLEHSSHYHRIPEKFTEGESRKTWKLRCRWWVTRHFSKKILTSEINSDDLELLAYKAACASHMYGQEFNYVQKACKCLEQNDMGLFKLLKKHLQNSIGIHSNL